MPNALITGVTGQDGAYLSKLLLEKGYDVHGGVRRIGVPSLGRLSSLGIEKEVILHDFEISEITNIIRVLDAVRPDEIYNLAAQSFVGTSFDQPVYTGDINALGVLRILEALRVVCPSAKFYQASSSEMFGHASIFPQNEATPFYPRSPYATSKVFGHWSTVNYREAYNLFACSGILFNHESPLRGREFVTRKITLELSRVKRGMQRSLELGNLNSKRDWGFAGDYVLGMWLMLQNELPSDYVLATGSSRTVREFVETAAACLDMQLGWRNEGSDEEGYDTRTGDTIVKVNARFYRPAEVNDLLGDASKAETKLGWRPVVSFNDLVNMMIKADYDLVAHPPTF